MRRGSVLVGVTATALAIATTTASAAPYDTGTTSRVTLRTMGVQSTDAPSEIGISTSGRYVAFISTDPSLVANDANGPGPDLFVHDRVAKTIRLVGLNEYGQQTPYEPPGTSGVPFLDGATMAANGAYVAYTITDGGSGQHGFDQAYVRNLQTGVITVVGSTHNSVATLGFSANGRYLLLESGGAYEPTTLEVFDTVSKSLTTVYESSFFATTTGSISNDGRYVTIESLYDPDRTDGVYRIDRQANTVVSVATGGHDPVMTPDGRYIAWDSTLPFGTPDTNKTYDVFRKDMTTKQIIRVSLAGASTQANGASYPSSISDNGDFIAFTSAATNLVPGDTNGRTDVFVREVNAKLTRRADLTGAGKQANGGASLPMISGDGKHVIFRSTATNLVAGDTNGVADGFVRDTVTPK